MSLLEEAFRGRMRAAPVPLPGLAPMPLLGARGNVLKFFADPFAVLRRVYAEHGALAALTAGRPEVVFAFGPEHARPLLNDRDDFAPFISTLKAAPGSALERLATRNLFCVDGDIHTRERAITAPPFHRRCAARWTRDIVALADETAQAMTPGDTVDLPHAMQGYTLAVIMRVVFGLDAATRREEVTRIRDLLLKVLELAGNPAAALLPLDAPGTPYRALRDCAERFEREVTRLAAHAHPDSALGALRAEPADYLSGRLFGLLTAGHETTFSALSWTLALLAQHPDVLAALTDEVAPFATGELDPEALRALPLLDAVIKESLRLFPPAAYGARVLVRDAALGGVHLPRGAVVIFSHFITQHMAALYPEPARFDPGRWAGLHPSPYAYMPFGAGPRACPGAEFARVEMAALLARLLPRVWPEIPDGIALDARLRITLRPHPALPVRWLPSGKAPRRARVRGTFNDCVTVGA
jgi:cytochrome P450